MSVSNSANIINNILNEISELRHNGLSCDSINLNSSNLLEKFNFLILSTGSHKIKKRDDSFLNPSNASNSGTLLLDHDYEGALYYIIFVLIWYAFCVICMIKIQTKKNDLDYYTDSEDDENKSAHGLLKRIRDDKIKREALEELVKPGFRDRMWDIYSDTPNAYKIRRLENKKIQNIDRKLKQYYSKTGEYNNSKTVDLSQIERRNPRDNNLYLLKDVNKLDNNSSSFNNSSTINSFLNARNSFTINSYDSGNQRLNLLNMNFEPPKTPKLPNRFQVEKIKEF